MMETVCPYCDYLATDHETLEGQDNPNDGEISFCIFCGQVSEFSNGELVKVNIDTLDEETRREIKNIESAWIRTRAIRKMSQGNKE